MNYTMGSLFAGIGGFDLGFERAGFKTAWQVEIDPYCQNILAKNFPEAERFGDIRECGRHNLKPVDVICGGFPCQDISNAGKRAGIGGERSGLWSEYARIIRELRPAYVLVENVAALLGRGMGVVLGDLAEIGYDAEWEVISAAAVGAPHLRERVWIVAYSICQRHVRSATVTNPSNNKERHCAAYEQAGRTIPRTTVAGSEEMAYATFSGLERSGNAYRMHGGESAERSGELGRVGGRIAPGFWAVEPNVGRVAHGVPKRVDRLRGLGNAVVPQIPEMIARRIKQALEAA